MPFRAIPLDEADEHPKVRVIEAYAPTEAKPVKKSQSLGFDEGFAGPIDNLASFMDQGLQKLGLPTDKISHALGQESTDEINARHKAEFREQEKTATPGGVGKFLGGALAAAPAVAISKNPWIVGAAQGALNADDPHDTADVALNAAGGAVLNKAGGVAMDKLSGFAKPVIDPAVRLLKDAGVHLTPGQVKGGKAMIREDKAMSRPRVGELIADDRGQSIVDFNRGGVNRFLLPLGVKVPETVKTGHDAIAFMQDEVGKAYERLMPNLKLAPDPRLAVGARKAMQVVADLPDREADIFQKVVSNKLDFSNGAMGGRKLAVALRDIRKAATGYSKSGNEAERQLGQALDHVDDAIHSSLGAQNPGYAKQLKATNSAYAGSRIMSDAAKGADEGIASTGQMKSAVRQNDRSKNQRKTAAGRAKGQDYSEAGRKVLPAKTPDSGTAGRLQSDKLIPNIRGAIDAAGYKADKAYTDFLLADRPGWVKKLGGLLEDLRPQGGLITGGLLSGLRTRDE